MFRCRALAHRVPEFSHSAEGSKLSAFPQLLAGCQVVCGLLLMFCPFLLAAVASGTFLVLYKGQEVSLHLFLLFWAAVDSNLKGQIDTAGFFCVPKAIHSVEYLGNAE